MAQQLGLLSNLRAHQRYVDLFEYHFQVLLMISEASCELQQTLRESCLDYVFRDLVLTLYFELKRFGIIILRLVSSPAWEKLLEQVVREYVLEFLSSFKFRDHVVELDIDDTWFFSWEHRDETNNYNLIDYCIGITTRNHYDSHHPLYYTTIKNPIRRLVHRLLTLSVAGRHNAKENVTLKDLFFLHSMDGEEMVDVLWNVAKFLSDKAKGYKKKSMIVGAHFIGRIARSYRLMSPAYMRIVTLGQETSLLNTTKLVELGIFKFNALGMGELVYDRLDNSEDGAVAAEARRMGEENEGGIWYDEDIYDLRSVETEFLAIVFSDNLTSNETLFYEPTVSSLNNNEIDFRISFDESDDEDYTVVFDKNSFSYKIISANDLKTDSENDNEKVNMPLFPSPEPSVSCIDDLDFFKDFENEFPAIVYNYALTSKSDFLTEPTLCP
ncbi:hypothetical protein Tco_0549646 [Tanacetum coccineum]